MRTCLLLGLLVLFGCNKESEQLLQDIQQIQAYLQTNNIQATEDEAAHYFFSIISSSTDTLSPARYAGLTVELRYKAQLLDGTVLHNSNGQVEQIELDDAIIGWQLALPRMDINETMLLILPSRLAYGEEGTDRIPPHSVLLFEIELLDIFPRF